jgi:GntR family transcriptional regulator of vanillate catabolism
MERHAVMNVKFHRLIADGSGNEALLRALALNDAVPFSASTAVVATSADPLESYRGLVHAHYQHRDIVHAIENGEGARAEALMKEHSNITKRIVHRMRELGAEPKARIPGAHLIAV